MESLPCRAMRARDGPLYVTLFAGWLLFSLASLFAVGYDSWNRVGAEFAAAVERQFLLANERLASNEAVLEGFAAFLGAVDAPSYEEQVRFATRIRDAHPQVYMVEVVEHVPEAGRAALEAQLAERTGGDGRLSRFDYVAGRSWGPVPHKPVYYPVTFVWPENPASLRVLGLDLDAVPHLRNVLRTAGATGVAVSSGPFELIEGPLAYVMLKAVQAGDERDGGALVRRFALLVIRADSLRPEQLEPHTAQSLRVLFPADGATPTLYDVRESRPASALERLLLPKKEVVRIDFSSSQQVALSMRRQMRVTDLSRSAFALTTALSAASLALLVRYVRHHRRRSLQVYEDYLRASHGAMHDPLTGLANRRLLYDRIEQAIARWRRGGDGFALVFVDLDHFKAINDTHGHEAGDAVLHAVAGRLERAVRETDTVARIAGDEFVVVLAGVRAEPEAVVVKLSNAVAEPIALPSGVVLDVSASFGISRCPEDGEIADALLNRADCAMYRYKRHE